MHRLTIPFLFVAAAACSGRKHRHGPEDEPAATRPDPAAVKAAQDAEDARRARVDAAVTAPLAVSDAPCAHEPMRPPAELGELSLAMPHDNDIAGKPGDQTYGYLLLYLRLIGSDVEVVSAPGSGSPLEPRAGFDGPHVTLVIDRWTDPQVMGDEYASGELDGRLLVWDSTAKAFACGAQVTARNGHLTIVQTDTGTADVDYGEDPLSKARVDLINEALRAGLGGLHAIAAAH